MSTRYSANIISGVSPTANVATASGVWSIEDAMQQTGDLSWPAASTGADPNFKDVTLLLTGDGTNGGQNNTFIDSSANSVSMTRFGNATQGSFSPFRAGWSNHFDGTGDYLTVANNAALSFGTGDFTIELWVNFSALSTNRLLLDRWASGNANSWQIYWRSTGTSIAFLVGASTVLLQDPSTTNIVANTWNHIAVTRSGTTNRLFINGAQVASATNSTSLTSSLNLGVGTQLSTLTNYFEGYISNVRILNGTALYTQNFPVPAAPLQSITNTALLTCHTNRFVDGSANGLTVTRSGDARVQPFNPFGSLTSTNTPGPYSASEMGGSAYFDGTGDYLTAPDSDAYFFDSGDFTLEAWVYLSVKNAFNIFQQSNGTGGNVLKWAFWFNNSTNQLRLEGHNPAASPLIWVQASWTPVTGRWYHLACSRESNVHRLFVDGALLASTTTTTALPQCASDLWVGAFKDAPAASPNQLNGYMAGARIVKGTALYTANFSIPTAPPTAVTNTSLLLNFTNGQIVDSAASSNLETIGSAQISTSVRRVGTGSISFNGTTDWLVIPASPTQALGTSPFTVEAWVYMTATAGTKPIFDNRGSGASATGFSFFVNSSSQLCVFTNNAATGTSSVTLSTNTWTHVALVRTGTGTNQTTYYINGVARGTITLSGNFTDPLTSVSRVGASVAGEPWPGNIDDMRVTKMARYTGAFTPPELLSTY